MNATLERPKAKRRRGRPLKPVVVKIRPGTQADLVAIDAIRAPFYSKYDQVPVDPPGLIWVVAERNGEIAACVGIVKDSMRGCAWVYDFLGTNATAFNHLRAAIERYGDKNQLTLVGNMAIDNKNSKIAFRHGWVPAATIMRRAPKPVNVGKVV